MTTTWPIGGQRRRRPATADAGARTRGRWHAADHRASKDDIIYHALFAMMLIRRYRRSGDSLPFSLLPDDMMIFMPALYY